MMAAVAERTRPAVPTPRLLDLIEVPLLRPWHVIVPLVLVTAGGVAAGRLLPKKYTSSTLILVESEKVPDSFVSRVTTDTAGQRLQTVRQEVLSRTRLEKVMRDTHPYPELDGAPLSGVLDAMRAAIAINVKGDDAFSIEYTHRDPALAMAVTDRLATLFIEETVHSREKQVAGAYEFIESQLQDARRELEEKDAAVRRYKESHLGTLPEQMGANLATLQGLQVEQQAIADSIRASMERETALESAPPEAGLGAAAGLERELAQLESRLVELRGRYTDEHPEVLQLLGRIARLRRAAHAAAPSGDTPASTVRARMEIQTEVARLRARREDVERRLGELRGRVDRAPRTEQELATLTRDYQKLNEHYLALLNKKLDAQMAEKLERRWKGEQFRILDPAYLPERPVSPKRWRILLLAMLAGLASGLGLAFAADFLSDSFRHPADLERLAACPLLGSVSHAATSSGWRARLRRALAGRSRHPGSGSARAQLRPRAARLERPPRRAARE